MEDFTARFVAPLPPVRPRGRWLIEGFSPKLHRRVRVFSHASFTQSMRLKADSAVKTFCEHPACSAPEPAAQPFEFWGQGAEGMELLLHEPDQSGCSLSRVVVVHACGACSRTRCGQRLDRQSVVGL